jgi:hypothetical protein
MKGNINFIQFLKYIKIYKTVKNQLSINAKI